MSEIVEYHPKPTFIGEPYSNTDPHDFSDAELIRDLWRIDLVDRRAGFHGWRSTARSNIVAVLRERGVSA